MGYSQRFVEIVLNSGRAGHRFLSDKPVQLQVWLQFAHEPTMPVDLILTPFDGTSSAKVARTLHENLKGRTDDVRLRLTPIQGSLALTVDLHGLVTVVLPTAGYDVEAILDELRRLVILKRSLRQPLDITEPNRGVYLNELIDFAWGSAGSLKPDLRVGLMIALLVAARKTDGGYPLESDRKGEARKILALPVSEDFVPIKPFLPPIVWRISTNRQAFALGTSTDTIKADAAMRLFDVDCSAITWAVIDSGIDGSHPAFRDYAVGDRAIRIDKAYDFSTLRELASYDMLADPARRAAAATTVAAKLSIDKVHAEEWLKKLASDAVEGRPYDWDTLCRLLEVPVDRLPAERSDRTEGHGTHVSGVLAGDWRESDAVVFRGVCPTLRLYDLRVLGKDNEDTEFAVISALEFIQWLNRRNGYIVIHGANLSLGLHHDQTMDACGWTPVCRACDETVRSGVVVVAAAGNDGRMVENRWYGSYARYSTVSITDPGNTQSVITVGSTHRERPHEYGVSYFSSRGPTADGRAKPDVVAPGERIEGPLPDLGLGQLDGTSMAAPHVSGVAAMLMARYPELIGKPELVKSIIMKSATDLGREKHFQGAGLVDALRALQSI